MVEKQIMKARLDRCFSEGLGTPVKYESGQNSPMQRRLVGQYSMGNEPMSIFLISTILPTGPGKTQKRYPLFAGQPGKDNIFGIPGDRMARMSAFVVFLPWLYPVRPGIPALHIGSPFFEKICHRFAGRQKFKVDAKKLFGCQ